MTTEKTKLATAPGINWTRIEARIEADRKAAAAARKIERAALCVAFRDRGVTGLDARYDGYADSGNVGEITHIPAEVEIDDLRSRLEDFIWGVAYELHPGFEINDGAEGSFCWDIGVDRIDVDHATFYTARDEHLHEDI